MLGNLHVRFGVGAGVKLHGLHHAPMARVCLSLFEQRFLAPLVCLWPKIRRGGEIREHSGRNYVRTRRPWEAKKRPA